MSKNEHEVRKSIEPERIVTKEFLKLFMRDTAMDSDRQLLKRFEKELLKQFW